MPRPAALGVTVGAAGLAVVVAPLALVLTLIGAITAASPPPRPAARPGSTRRRSRRWPASSFPASPTSPPLHCPELPAAWVVAEVAAESGWNPAAFSRDRNGGAAGLYQLNQTNWVTAGGHPWTSAPPPPGADIYDPAATSTSPSRSSAPTCAPPPPTCAPPGRPPPRSTPCWSATSPAAPGSPARPPASPPPAKPAATPAAPPSSPTTSPPSTATSPNTPPPSPGWSTSAGRYRGLPAPTPFAGPDNGCTQPDPTSRGCLTPATRHALDQTLAAFGPPGPGAPLRRVVCWDPHPQNPRSDHRVGRACDLFPTTAGSFPTGTDLDNGWRLAAWLRTHAGELHIHYLIWQGRIWNPGTGDQTAGACRTPAAGSTTPPTRPAATTTTSTSASDSPRSPHTIAPPSALTRISDCRSACSARRMRSLSRCGAARVVSRVESSVAGER